MTGPAGQTEAWAGTLTPAPMLPLSPFRHSSYLAFDYYLYDIIRYHLEEQS